MIHTRFLGSVHTKKRTQSVTPPPAVPNRPRFSEKFDGSIVTQTGADFGRRKTTLARRRAAAYGFTENDEHEKTSEQPELGICKGEKKKLERETSLELATSTLARLRSTN